MSKIGTHCATDEEVLEHLLRHGAQLDYVPGFLGAEAALRTLQVLLEQLRFPRPEESRVFVHGRWHDPPRRVTAYGDAGLAYRYSGRSTPARPWQEAPALIALTEMIAARSGLAANFALVNAYQSGRDAIGAHSDDERDLGPAPTIVSSSLGAAREFRFANRQQRDIPSTSLTLAHGSLLIMRHPTNREWTHALPRAGV